MGNNNSEKLSILQYFNSGEVNFGSYSILLKTETLASLAESHIWGI